MGPHDLAPNTVPPEYVDREQAIIGERNWFYNALAPAAKERFLEELTLARESGLDEHEAWIRAARAAELEYEDISEVGEMDVDERLVDERRGRS